MKAYKLEEVVDDLLENKIVKSKCEQSLNLEH